MSIKRQLSSSGFRIVGLYVFFYLITAIGFLWLMFSVLGSEIKNSVKADIERENSLIIDGLDENSDDALHKRLLPYIEKADVLSEVYILLDSSGNVLLANYPYDVKLELGWAYLDELEDEDEPYEDDDDDDDGILFGYLDFDIIPENSEDEGYIGWVSKVGEQTLLVGRTLDRIDETKDIFVRMALIVFPLSLILAILGGMIFNRLTTRRIEVINEQCRSIRRQGDLSLRVPNEKPDDEYGLLIANINAMLDTIDKGVRNVQEVSNDVAHDLRTPLTRIKYGLEAGLLNENTTKTELSEILETSLSETDSLLDTFSAILRISQLNTGLRKSRFKVFDLTYLVQTIVEAYADWPTYVKPD